MADDYDEILDGIFHRLRVGRVSRPGRGRAGLAFERGNPPPGIPALRRLPPGQEPGDPIAKAEAMTMTDTGTINVGDQVGYRATDGEILGSDRGKVLGIFRTRDGKTLADVEWDGLGMPKRVGIERLTRIMASDR